MMSLSSGWRWCTRMMMHSTGIHWMHWMHGIREFGSTHGWMCMGRIIFQIITMDGWNAQMIHTHAIIPIFHSRS